MSNIKVIRPQKGPQEKFLSTTADIAIYGGAAGGGKSYGLLIEPLRYKNNKRFGAVIFRHEYKQIFNQGGLWDTSNDVYGDIKGADGRYSAGMWKFKNGMTVAFDYINRDDDLQKWQGSQITMIGFDELTHFSEKQFFYMLSRNRSVCGVKPYMRATCNTDTSAFSTAFAELGTKSGTDAATAFQAADYSGVGAAVGSGISSAITNADMAQINSAVDALKSNTDSSVNSAFGAGVSTTMPVSVTLDYSLVNPTKTFTIGGGGSGSTTLTVSAHASGGYVNDKQLSWVGEEGPEAIIPLVPGRRNRALELYKEVGDILGVQANANGNIIGEAAPLGGGSGSTTIGSTATEMFAYSSISDFLSLNDNLLAEAIRNGATGYNGFTEGTESDSDTADEPLSSSSTVETGKTNINLNIQMSPQFNISDSGTGKMDEASIMAIIRKNMKSMADELGGEIADRLEQVFSNMPVVKEG